MEPLVYFTCVKVGNKLRVRVITPGYLHDANCQFPSAIRIEGRNYAAPASAVSFSRGSTGTFFYRVKAKEVRIVDGVPQQAPVALAEPQRVHIDRIYRTTEEGDDDCLICADAKQDVVFAPCGHFCACFGCANRIFGSRDKRCPVCRTPIQVVCTMDMVQLG